ncbi:DUF4931 domain-containing protein [Marininema halotolerans]|uniref:Galactose-1-phosphate uridylyltransferase n=1 Tax=Marininema halotolerans TaxID=1155944 RepID=A0A1I6PRX4_9BACL|nr:DUF4931 domain-containing protein [Marininema halotolerans]SFS42838.1 protein of unknown function [Marininema halotolerans]
MKNQLTFLSQVGIEKVKSRPTDDCPFCNRSGLTGIIAEDGPILLVENKYATIRDTYQTVLIETDCCDVGILEYSLDHVIRLLRFGLKHWERMKQSGDFQSVLFFKNHGPLSGGSVAHAHMQLVGLKHVDYRNEIPMDTFTGETIIQDGSVHFSLSTSPLASFSEFNLIIGDTKELEKVAIHLKNAVDYILNKMNCRSYNLFFYDMEGKIYLKVVPRYPASPYTIGYHLKQVNDNIGDKAREIAQEYYLNMGYGGR